MHFLFFRNLTNYDGVCKKQDFYFLDKKNVESRKIFYIKLHMSIFSGKTSPRPAQIFLSETSYVTTRRLALYFRWNFTLILAC